MLKEHKEAIVLDRVFRSFHGDGDGSYVVRMYQVHKIKNGENLDSPEGEVLIQLGDDEDGPSIQIVADDQHALRVLSTVAAFAMNDLAYLMSKEFENM